MVETKEVIEESSKSKKDKTKNDKNKNDLIKSTISKIKHIILKDEISEMEVYLIVKNFFKEYLELNFEFTHEELIDELEKNYIEPKLKTKIVFLIKTIGVIEYSDTKFTFEKLKNMLFCFEETLLYLLKDENNNNKHKYNFFELLKSKKEEKDIEKEIFKKNKNCFESFEEEMNYSKLSFEEKINFVEELAKKNIENAREKYNQLVLDYERLDSKTQKNIYLNFLELYEIIKK
jgi:hypothetical protein